MKALPYTLALAALLCPMAAAQETTDSALDAGDKIEATSTLTDAKDAAAKTKAGKMKKSGPWSYRASLSGVYDDNIEQEEDARSSRGTIAAASVRYKNKTPIGDLQLDYEVGSHHYSNTEKWNRTTHDVEGTLEHKISPLWRARTQGTHSWKKASADGDIRDVATLEQRVEYRITPVYRVRATGALRTKRYDYDARRNSHDPYYGFTFAQRYPSGVNWDTAYRFDSNRAADGRFSYRRWTFDTEVGWNVTPRDAITVGARYRTRRYNERWVATETGVSRRKDIYRGAGVRWDHALRDEMTLRLDYNFDARRSNTEGNKFDNHIAAVTLIKKW